MDVDDNESVTRAFDQVITEHGAPSAVLACAGWGLAGAAEQSSIEDAMAQLNTNFWGAVRIVNAALPGLRERGGGHIVLMSSIGGILGIPYQAFYARASSPSRGTPSHWPTRSRPSTST